MKTKHTKGEWKVSDRLTNGVEGYEIHYSDDGECITDHVYTLEDAKLIAAAPELLDACNELLGLLEFHGYRNATEIYKAKEAIKKATLKKN